MSVSIANRKSHTGFRLVQTNRWPWYWPTA